MNLPSANSSGFAGPVPPPPPISFFLVLPDGSCIPATSRTRQIIMKQARSEARKQLKIKRMEKAAELQSALEDRAAARRVQKELEELHRSSLRWAGRFKAQVQPERPATRTSPVRKHSSAGGGRSPVPLPDAARPPSSWVVDDLGMKGIIWQQSYVGRKSARFYPGAARDNWYYIIRDEAVLLDAEGEPFLITNMGADWVEVGAAWQAMEDASTRANAKVQMLAIAPFDSDMSQEEMVYALTHFCKTVLEPLDLPYSAAIHRPPAGGDVRNFHPHLAFSGRPMRWVEPYCWEVADEVCGEIDGRDGVQMLRHLWAHSMSEAAEHARSSRRYTGLGYGARRLDMDAGEHLGDARSAIVERGGIVPAHERNRIKNQRNALRRAVRDADRKIEALTKVRDAALERTARSAALPQAAKVFRSVPVVAPMMRLQPADQTRSAATIALRDVQPARVRTVSSEATPANQPLVACRSADHAPPTVESAASAPAGQFRSATINYVQQPRTRTASDVVAAAKVLTPARQPAPRHHPAAPAVMLGLRVELAVSGNVDIPVRTRSIQPVQPLRERAASTTAAPTGAADEHDLALVLTRTRGRRDRERAEKRRRSRQATIAEVPSLADLPRRDLLEAFPTVPAAGVQAAAADADYARIRQLIAMDTYVADYGGDALDISWRAMKAIEVDDAWLSRPWVQRGLAVIRAKQKSVVQAMVDDADSRPLAYAKAGTRFWPRDLDTDRLRRLDRWATDPGFQQDVFGVERRIYQAHQTNDAAMRRAAEPLRTGDLVSGNHKPTWQPGPDGLGGWRDKAPPVFIPRTVSPRVEPFDAATRAPHRALLRLLHYAGNRPGQFAFADDGKLMTLPGTNKGIEPLVMLWRDDPQVEALLVETVTASRAAGRPVWPEAHRIAVHALSGSANRRRTGHRPASGRER